MLNTDDRVSLLDAGLPVGSFTTCITLLLVIVPDCDLSVNFAIVDCGWLNVKVYAIKRAFDADWERVMVVLRVDAANKTDQRPSPADVTLRV